MKAKVLAIGIVAAFFLLSRAAGLAAESASPAKETAAEGAGEGGELTISLEVPLFSPLFANTPVAVVDDQPITAGDLIRQIGTLHRDVTGEKASSAKDYAALLKRMINTSLIVQEARNIGFDELPRIKDAVETYSHKTLRGLEMSRHLSEKGVTAGEEEVDELYKNMVKEFKISSIFFENEEDAREAVEEIGEDNFADVARKVIEEGIAEGDAEGKYYKPRYVPTLMAEAAEKMEAGSVSPVIELVDGYVIFRLQDVRFPEDEKARSQAERIIYERNKNSALKNYFDFLREKYVDIKEQTVEGLDFETGDFDRFLKDERVLAEIEGEEPITVGDLATQIKSKLYHGVEKAAESKRINFRILFVFNDMMAKRVLEKEAIRNGLHETEDYKYMVAEYEKSLLFEEFLNEVIIPEVKLQEDEIRAYYDEHSHEYRSSEMMKIRSLVFHTLEDAEEALERLNKGADLKWVSANSEGQVDKATEDLVKFEGDFMPVKSFPEELRETVSGASPGDMRLYESPEGYYYILSILDVRPSEPVPYEKVERVIAKKLFDTKVVESVEDWGERLREYYDTRVFVAELD